MLRISLALFLTAALISATGPAWSQGQTLPSPTPTGRSLLETPIAQSGVPLDSLVISPDGRRFAYVASEGGKSVVIVDGKREKPYDAVQPESLQFSPDSQHLAYVAKVGAVTVINLVFVFIPIPAQVPVWAVVVDGKEGKSYPAIRSFGFSPDGQRVAQVAGELIEVHGRYIEGAGMEHQIGEWRIVVDGQEGKAYDSVGRAIFSPDSRRVAYLAGRQILRWPSGGSTERVAVVDGKEGKPYDAILGLKFSPDSQHLAYVARTGSLWFGVVDGQEGESYSDVGAINLSPDAKKVAYVVQVGDKITVFMDQKEGKSYDNIAHVVFSSDSQRLAYVARAGDTRVAVVDGEEGKPYDEITGLSFSPDSRRVAYAARTGTRWVVVLDRVEGMPHDAIEPESLKFSPDGQRVVYVVRAGDKWTVVVDGKEGKPYDEITGLGFSPDSRRTAYIAKVGGRVSVVVEGTEGPSSYDNVTNLVFDSLGALHYLATRGGSTVLVEERL